MSQSDGGVPRPTAKQRASGIPLDYYKQPDRLARWKIWLSAAAVIAAVGWWAAGWALGRVGGRDLSRMRYSHGPVARVHATWDAQCEACHVDFRPISGGATWAGALGANTKASDQKCQACHAGPPHHDNQVAAEVKTCAGCHRDHRGVDASLVRLPDSDCTSCHARLASHTEGGKAGYEDVKAFDRTADHPEFAILRAAAKAKDPGKLKFNHALHLTPGLNPGGKPVWTLGRIADKDERARYRAGQADPSDNAPVALDCQSCHQTDGGDASAGSLARLPASVRAPRGAGAYMQPIVYEKHCAACHALDVPVRAGGGKDGDGPRVATVRVPHRLQPAELRQELEGLILARALAADPEAKGRPAPARPRPLPSKPAGELKDLWQAVQAEVRAAERLLVLAGDEQAKRTCTECHYYRDKEGHEVAAPGAGTSLADYTVEPPRVPEVWFRHAAFSHAPHRAVSCRECHPGAYPDSPESRTFLQGLVASKQPTWKANEAVMLPGIEECRKCHVPSRRVGGMVLGGAGHECVECHTYHAGPGDRDAPARGLGSPARDGAEMTLGQFLDGTGTPKPAARAR